MLAGWVLQENAEVPESDFDQLVESVPFVIGRKQSGKAEPNVYGVTTSKRVSRKHLVLDWDETAGQFTLRVIGRNSITINRECRGLARRALRCWGDLRAQFWLWPPPPHALSLRLACAEREYGMDAVVPVKSMTAVRLGTACFYILLPKADGTMDAAPTR